MGIDLSRLNSFSQETYHKIIAKHPEWEKYAKLEKFHKNAKPDQDTEYYLSIEISSPVKGVFPIEITTIEEVPEEITLYCGPAHYHMRMYLRSGGKTLDDQLAAVEEIIQKIFNEELIAVQKKPGFFGFIGEGFVSREDYQKLLAKGKLQRAVSWNGTFNYPYDGSHQKWN